MQGSQILKILFELAILPHQLEERKSPKNSASSLCAASRRSFGRARSRRDPRGQGPGQRPGPGAPSGSLKSPRDLEFLARRAKNGSNLRSKFERFGRRPNSLIPKGPGDLGPLDPDLPQSRRVWGENPLGRGNFSTHGARTDTT